MTLPPVPARHEQVLVICPFQLIAPLKGGEDEKKRVLLKIDFTADKPEEKLGKMLIFNIYCRPLLKLIHRPALQHLFLPKTEKENL